MDEEFAAVTGVRPSRYLLVMDLAIAFTEVIASKAAGVLLVSSLLVVPPSIALVSAVVFLIFMASNRFRERGQ